jgi:hypothetical protein
MSHRTQITLTDEQRARLLALSGRTGLSLSELIRRAVDRSYAPGANGSLDESFGAWSGRRFDGETYVEQLRTGLAGRLDARAGGR